MYRFLLTPRWWGINIFVVLAIPFCVYMGSWQLGRFEDRVDAQRAADARPAADKQRPAVPLEELLPVDKATSGRIATATGRYGEQLLVPGRELDGRQGFYVLGLLRTDGGETLPVVRGWLPGEAGSTPVPAVPEGRVTITGALQASENSGTDGVRTGGLPEGQVGMISAAALVNLVPDEVYDAWITLSEGDAGMRAVPATVPQGTGLDLKAFQNLGYTGEWFVFAAFVLFMWFRLFRREAEVARDVSLGLVGEDAAARDEAEAETETDGGGNGDRDGDDAGAGARKGTGSQGREDASPSVPA
ncbi:SURF1 family protein [Streptomyces sp. GC420]|uniref:SURF1 family protein n=1 Tax=Streptomyces sp. GC420 TaxID=2697568 RepID=UPI001414DBA5|nr:SURF1 family protein [Streptomyces sp. GC420]NBM18296.1 SURF1 family protein [Streptomyces sp. GC420]